MELIKGATTTFTGSPMGMTKASSVQAVVSGTGAVSSTIIVEVSNETVPTNYITLGTISLSGTTTATDGFAFTAKWDYIRARITAIAGTSATVTVSLGGG